MMLNSYPLELQPICRQSTGILCHTTHALPPLSLDESIYPLSFLRASLDFEHAQALHVVFAAPDTESPKRVACRRSKSNEKGKLMGIKYLKVGFISIITRYSLTRISSSSFWRQNSVRPAALNSCSMIWSFPLFLSRSMTRPLRSICVVNRWVEWSGLFYIITAATNKGAVYAKNLFFTCPVVWRCFWITLFSK